MTDYVKSTNFTSKDSLPSGNALKIIKGTEFDVEFNNIVTAVSTKADSISPTLSGVPTAPTATAGTDTTQIASTAFVNAAIVPKANLASPTFTGVPAAPTATAGTNTTQLATTAFVTAADTVAVTSAVSQAATAAAAAYPTKSGSGATGTWGINISGNAATATNATNATTAANGGVTSVNGATGAVTVSLAPASIDSVGSIVACVRTITANPSYPFSGTVGETIAGSSLRYNYSLPLGGNDIGLAYTNVFGTAYAGGGTALSGTWRCISRDAVFVSDGAGLWKAGLWQRIS